MFAVFAVGVVTNIVTTSGDELFHAWQLWSQGRSVSTEPLWGHPVLWWARLGKILQFVAGLVVVFDLIGPERLRAVGRRASNGLREARSLALRLQPSLQYSMVSAVRLGTGLFLVSVNASLAFLLATRWSTMSGTPATLIPFVVAPAFLLVYLWIGGREAASVLRLPALGLGWLLATLTLGTAAAALDKANPGHLIRWLALLLFMIGFSLDLLGS